ncbi:MAG: Gfo/Idh/MocA family oxidoreductase [Bacteroidota bacterium]|nr:Gfo/Idh/MocA family oxidoreductase [Bacteroidota bacterium]
MEFENIGLAVIGAGRWGMNHVKSAYKLLNSNLKFVCDFSESAREKVSKVSPLIPFSTDLEDVLIDSTINAVIIATPAETHFEVAKKCLEAGKNVLVEKPITLYTEEAAKLIEIAEVQNKKLMVGHILLYHPAIIKIKELIDNGKIGKLQYIYSNRLNLGAIRSEENILWSFAPHDISIIQYIAGCNPIEVFSKGSAYVQNNIEDTTITYLKYPNNVNAHIFVSWLHPFKEQRLVITGSNGMLVFEDSLKNEKLKFFEKGFRNIDGIVSKFEQDYEVVPFSEKQPLEEEQSHFFNCILKNKQPLTDGLHALEVLNILEQATAKLKNGCITED